MKGLGSDRCTKVQKSPDPNKNWSGFATLKLSLYGITHWQPGVKVNNQQNFEKFQESVAISVQFAVNKTVHNSQNNLNIHTMQLMCWKFKTQ